MEVNYCELEASTGSCKHQASFAVWVIFTTCQARKARVTVWECWETPDWKWEWQISDVEELTLSEQEARSVMDVGAAERGLR